jgi:hypothetical protein
MSNIKAQISNESQNPNDPNKSSITHALEEQKF